MSALAEWLAAVEGGDSGRKYSAQPISTNIIRRAASKPCGSVAFTLWPITTSLCPTAVCKQGDPKGVREWVISAVKITQPEKRGRSIHQANQLNLKRIEAVEDDEYPLSSYAS